MGFALFAMHFGAGNLVFPLALGRESGAHALFELVGLLLTGVCVPMLGFLAMMRFEGQTRRFFQVFGSKGGLCLMAAIVAVLCPFGAIPRCIACTHTAIGEFFGKSTPSLEFFCLIAVGAVFLMTIKEKRIIPLLAKVLTPLLLGALALILVGGFFSAKTISWSMSEGVEHLSNGLVVGYQTMDLLAALFFSGMLFYPIREYAEKSGEMPFRLACETAGVAGFLLGAVYVGFGLLAASHGEALQDVPKELLLVRLAEYTLGGAGGIVTLICVIFACFTTAIALSAIFARFLQDEIFRGKIGYGASLGATLAITYFVAILSFEGIAAFLGPILEVFYPLLIGVSLYNLRAREVRA